MTKLFLEVLCYGRLSDGYVAKCAAHIPHTNMELDQYQDDRAGYIVR